jgi:hypothetical protein
LSAYSEGRDKGATFCLSLPLSEAVQTPETKRAHIPGNSDKHLRILLVEDYGVSAKMIQQVLTAEGHQVEIAGAMGDASVHCTKSNW